MDPKLKAFLDLIGKSEGAKYNTLFGGKTFTDFSKHPNICVPYGSTCSTAAGKYQILKGTYDTYAPGLGITDFSPSSQDKLAIKLIKQRGAYNLILAGDIQTAIQKCGNEWASFGYNSYGQPTHSIATLLSWYEGFFKTNASSEKKNLLMVGLLLLIAGYLYYKTVK